MAQHASRSHHILTPNNALCVHAFVCSAGNACPCASIWKPFFEFSHLGTNWRTEILAGVTTFLTMAYIVLVNPAILADAGVPSPAATAPQQGPAGNYFVFFFVDLFDNLGTLVTVTKRAGLITSDHSIPRLSRILFADATATIFGSLAGTSTVTSYVKSTAGVAAGGRSGVTPVVTGLLFLVAIAAAPFVGVVPTAATAPALILVGSMMLANITEIEWHDPLVAVPAFLTLVLIPFTYWIANGLGYGIVSWAVLHLVAGKFRRQDWLLYLIAILFVARFISLGGG